MGLGRRRHDSVIAAEAIPHISALWHAYRDLNPGGEGGLDPKTG